MMCCHQLIICSSNTRLVKAMNEGITPNVFGGCVGGIIIFIFLFMVIINRWKKNGEGILPHDRRSDSTSELDDGIELEDF